MASEETVLDVGPPSLQFFRLTGDDGPSETLDVVEGPPPFELIKWIREEWTRFVIVAALLLIFAALVGTAIYASLFATHWESVEKMLGIVLASVTGLLGTALGFYFRLDKKGA